MESRWTRGIGALVALTVVVLIAAGGATIVINGRIADHERRVVRGYELISLVRQTIIALQDAETGQRNYMLTGRSSFLTAHEQARVRLDGLLRQLDASARIDQDHARQAGSLHTLAAQRVDELASTLRRHQASGRESALALLESLADGDQAIRQIATSLIDREQLAIGESLKALRSAQVMALVISVATLGFALACLLATVLLVVRGSSNLHAARRDLAARSQLLQATLETLQDPLVVFDRHGDVVTWNEPFARLIEWNPAELPQISRTALLSERFPKARTLLKAMQARDIAARVTERVAIDGREFEVTLAQMSDGGAVVRCVDVTEQLRNDVALRQGQKMEAVGQLTGGMAHDFNNILQVILTNLERIRDDLTGNAPALSRLQSAVAAAQRGARLTQQLLAFARRQPLAPLAIDVGRLVKDMVELLRHSVGERIVVDFALSDDIGNIKVDPGQLENAILNLALNARDAMPDGGTVRVEVANANLDRNYAVVHPDVSPGEYVMVSVSDTGSGMPPEIVAQAFDPFFTTKRDGQGTGLGLSMVYGFVRQSGGHVRIDSQVGQGTSVKLYLPRTSEAVIERPYTEPVERTRNERILVVEDNDEVRLAVAAMLEDLGYQVEAANGSDAALKMLKDDSGFDILFTDVVMPGSLSGIELARAALGQHPKLAVLLTSGFAMDELDSTALDSTFPMISKPYRQEDLATKLRTVLAETRARLAIGDVPLIQPLAQEDGPAPQIRRVLLVEDEVLVRMSTVDMLERLGCEVEAAATGEQALELLKRGKPFDMLVADLGLPGISGEELAAEAHRLYPKLRIVIASGYRAGLARQPLPEGVQFISKPYSMVDLRHVVELAVPQAA